MNDKKYEEREACLQLRQKGLSRKEIAERLGLTERQVKRRLSASFNGDLNKTKFGGGVRPNVELEKFKWDTENDDYFNGSEEFSFPLSKDKSLFRHEEGDKKRKELAEYIERKYKGKKLKILYLADLHIPFTIYEEVLKALKKHRDADIVVINGDLLDLFAVSKFAKDKEVALRRELEEGRELLEFIAKHFNDVIVIEGNHERRLKSYIRNIIPTDLQFLFPDDILQMVVSGEVLDKEELDNVHVVGSWWIKLFDTIFAHPDNYSSANLKTVQNTSEYFTVVKNIHHRACIIGHTHRTGWLVSGEVLLMETGCLCYDMDYHNGSNFTKTKWTRAYATVLIDEHGAIDFNESKLTII
jgi:predicted phosphodiesterase